MSKGRNRFMIAVLRKELRDILRDRKTLLTTLLLPLVLYPAMFLLMGGAMDSMIRTAEEETAVAIMADETIKAYLRDDVLAGISGVLVSDVADPMAALERDEVKVVLISEDEGDALGEDPLRLSLVYDDKKSGSSASMSYLKAQLSEYSNSVIDQRLADMGIRLSELSPLIVGSEAFTQAAGTAGDTGSAGMMLEMLLPMMVIIFLASGALAPAADMFAGEKERKTMEPLLCTRAGRGAILGGKFWAITVFSLITVLVSVIGMALGYLVNPAAMTMSVSGAGEMTLRLPLEALFLIVVLVAMLAMTFSGLYASISAYARTIKEASSYGTYVMLASYIPIFSTMFTQAGDIQLWMMVIPLFNVAGSLKMVLGGLINYAYLGVAVASTAIFLMAALLLARSLFRRETIMLRM